ncbi:hypothetical protein OXPF_00850 [Oxobacter pfennigii]|uniref:Uncharacterized protein n=1 Tax=Oxobacter pfennigii TaxID=36849 RepID=A0A0P8WUA1_9CLOT|nr:hypothetical protein [Oxobacter pfennigii]KPU46298.1 hypothetical protein OXPF_00850 [Oxobacter pfennigii]
MKFTLECKVCPCVKFTEDDVRYCVFRKPGGVVVIRDDPDKCVFIEETSIIYKNILEQYETYRAHKSIKIIHKEA